MARLRWVQAMLREWAAWIEGFGGGLHSPELDGLPRGNVFGSHLPKDTFSLRRTQQAIDRLDPEYQAVIRKMKKEMMRLKAETGDTDPDSERMHGILAAQGLE